MNTKIVLIASAALLAILTAPASARSDGDEGGASAYPRFKNERGWFHYSSHELVNRPSYQR
jgi:hypothetical protein